jgi:hypothetical protein
VVHVTFQIAYSEILAKNFGGVTLAVGQQETNLVTENQVTEN